MGSIELIGEDQMDELYPIEYSTYKIVMYGIPLLHNYNEICIIDEENYDRDSKDNT